MVYLNNKMKDRSVPLSGGFLGPLMPGDPVPGVAIAKLCILQKTVQRMIDM